jgi:hypothetical protein
MQPAAIITAPIGAGIVSKLDLDGMAVVQQGRYGYRVLQYLMRPDNSDLVFEFDWLEFVAAALLGEEPGDMSSHVPNRLLASVLYAKIDADSLHVV